MANNCLDGLRGAPCDDSGTRIMESGVPTRIRRVKEASDGFAGLRRAFQRYDRQMALAIFKTNLKRESIVRLPGDERPWRRTMFASWPAFAGFNAWTSIFRSQAEVDFIGCLTRKRHVGATLVVPRD